MARQVSIAYTPDSDDAFYYYALETGRLPSPDFNFSFHTDHIIALNRAARRRRFDVTAISSVAYPELAEHYRILSVGASVGRGYGPVLVSRRFHDLADVQSRRIGVAGLPTTGGFLARWSCPQAELVEMRFDLIADAVAAGKLDAGVMIHEELLYYPKKGLHAVADLGALWCDRTGLPLPVGLNVVSRRFDDQAAGALCDITRQSLVFALNHRQEALSWACRFGRGEEGGCGARHVSMFANADSVSLPDDARMALGVLFLLLVEYGIAPSLPRIDVVEGSPQSSREAMLALREAELATTV
ncbi:MAG TPA: MqnA/MqnD/SBP family protein [Pirellulales bacterium]|nr:MqnA/MqnD/SBP family protein [Pirellulales bacterium]